ncbi:hypothetical protein GCM10028832_05730 [Streptomyces sparsus]
MVSPESVAEHSPHRGVTGPNVPLGLLRTGGTGTRPGEVLRNVVGNAVQHTPPGSRVTVDVRRQDGDVVIRVADDGPGIAPEDVPRVFDRFWRAEASRSRAHGGSGLGLAIVDSIVRAHGGQVTAESAPGEGTSIVIRLPAPGGSVPDPIGP